MTPHSAGHQPELLAQTMAHHTIAPPSLIFNFPKFSNPKIFRCSKKSTDGEWVQHKVIRKLKWGWVGICPALLTLLHQAKLCSVSNNDCRKVKIDDLHFHDLRHEATSRFFEKGLNPVEVATITGHKDTKMLMRYTHLRAENLVGQLG